ncbi:serine dehydratase beta chain [Bradyrhizobium sp. RDI18]|uniref:serine dehydratase beta chain n=1 Tax=Bradyrhizobium sp. RDI18 TaxID=3367400 RepID=UPI0037151BDE
MAFGGEGDIAFTPETDLLFHRDKMLSEHPNGMIIEAFDGLGVFALPKHLFLNRRRQFSIRQRWLQVAARMRFRIGLCAMPSAKRRSFSRSVSATT